MSSTSSQASADSVSALSEQECEPLRSVNEMSSAAAFSIDTGPACRSSRTCAPQPFRRLTSSLPVSPARTCQTPAIVRSGPELPESVLDSSGRWCAPFAWYDPASSCWRTWQRCSVEGWAQFSEPWPRAGMTRNGIAYRRSPSVPLAAATGLSLLPSPTEKDSAGSRNATSSRKPGSRHHAGVTLTDWIWLKMGRGQPAPSFVEWIMGFPERWTDCPPWVTRSSRKSQKQSDAQS